MPNSFNGVLFELVHPIHGTQDMIPRWPDRSVPEISRMGSIEDTLLGIPALQEVERKSRPITLEFRESNMPGALMTEAMLQAFVTAWKDGGTHTLVIEGVSRTVILDWDFQPPVEWDERTPTGALNVPGTRLYEGVVHLRELTA